jgi:hypothetical protein
MIDARKVIYAHLVSLGPALGSLQGRFYAGSEFPSGFSLASGPAVLFKERGGGLDYHHQAGAVSMQVQVYANTEQDAQRAAAVFFDVVDQTRGGSLLWLELEPGTVPVPLADPESGWPYVLMYFSAKLREE